MGLPPRLGLLAPGRQGPLQSPAACSGRRAQPAEPMLWQRETGTEGLVVGVLAPDTHPQGEERFLLFSLTGPSRHHIQGEGFSPETQAAQRPLVSQSQGWSRRVGPLCRPGSPSSAHPSVFPTDCPSILPPPTAPALCQALGPQHRHRQRVAELWRALGQSDLLRPLQARGVPGGGQVEDRGRPGGGQAEDGGRPGGSQGGDRGRPGGGQGEARGRPDRG